MTMNEPIEVGSDDAANTERVDGIVAQTRGDVASGHVTNVAEALRQRFDDAGIAVSAEQLEQLASEIS
jgi:hypothetical protein